MIRIIYTLFFYCLLPFIFVRLYYKSRKNPAYRKRLSERLGFFKAPAKTGGIWIHTVSVGETIAAMPLIHALKKNFPQYPLVMTCMTATGSERIMALMGDSAFHVYMPYDTPGAIKRFLGKTKPSLLILMETELWPNYLHYCKQAHIPVLLANARLSERSFQGYRRINFLSKDMIKNLSMIAAQAIPDADRFMKLGATKEQITVTGSIKFDISIPETIKEQAQQLRLQLGNNRPIWIAASTHDTEEELILKAFAKIREVMPITLLVLVPRHLERFDKVATLTQQAGYKIARRSKQEPVTEETDIYLGDTIGELLLLYGVCDVAFVGGSFAPIGGHNVLEPAALAKPVITGPYDFNFATIVQLLLEDKGLIKVTSVEELANTVIHWLQDPALRLTIGENAYQFVQKHKGATAAHIQLIRRLGLK